MSYITHTRDGSFCDVCGATLGQEEIDFECCDCCGGEGIGGDEDDLVDDEFEPEVAIPSTSGGRP